MTECDGCTRLRQSLKALRQDTDKRFADLGRRVRTIEATEMIPEDYRPPRDIKPEYVSHYVPAAEWGWK